MNTNKHLPRIEKLPRKLEGLFKKANSSFARGDLQGVLTYLKKMHQKAPNNLDVNHLLGFIAILSNNVEIANRYLQKALDLAPYNTLVNNSCAEFYLKRKLSEPAIKHLLLIHQVEPNNTANLNKLALCYQTLGDSVNWFKAQQELLRVKPSDVNVAYMAHAFSNVYITNYSLEYEENVLMMLSNRSVNTAAIMPQCCQLLSKKYHLDTDSMVCDLETIKDDPLLLGMLKAAPVKNFQVESWLVEVRNLLLQSFLVNGCFKGRETLVAMLAIQNHINEYVQIVTEDELLNIDVLLQNFITQPDISLFLVIALYQKPSVVMVDEVFADADCHWQQALLRTFYLEPQQEKSIAKELSKTGHIIDIVSQGVKAMYEENPYPRWTSVGRYMSLTFEDFVAREFQCKISTTLKQAPLNVLIAGCGTGQQSLQFALKFKNTAITAVDLSATSLAYAQRKTLEYNVANIDYIQEDILELAVLNKKFAVIECGGVLHHMRSPEKAWAALCRLLLPGGMMKIALYSETARTNINKVRQYVKTNDIQPDVESIRNFRNALMRHELDIQYTDEILKLGDVFNISGCRDLFFHVQEQQMTIPWIKARLQAMQLDFVGFEFSHEKHLREFKKMFPGAETEQDLDNWHEFELANPNTFIAMYQFWCKAIE
jgi:ubiquinone/menaquinone biosynthesis C-methylase UbiE